MSFNIRTLFKKCFTCGTSLRRRAWKNPSEDDYEDECPKCDSNHPKVIYGPMDEKTKLFDEHAKRCFGRYK